MEMKRLIAGAAMALSVSAMSLAAGAARAADVINAYNFSGTLANPINGGTSVTGHFTLDQTSGALSAYSFDTPFGVINSYGLVVTYSPAVSPATDFVVITLNPNAFESLNLWFQTDLASFSGSSFYTGPVHIVGGTGASGLDCFDPASCGRLIGNSGFASGAATIAAAVPEPATWAMMLAGFFGLGGMIRARRRVVAIAA
jgi:PEP-CTERM motif